MNRNRGDPCLFLFCVAHQVIMKNISEKGEMFELFSEMQSANSCCSYGSLWKTSWDQSRVSKKGTFPDNLFISDTDVSQICLRLSTMGRRLSALSTARWYGVSCMCCIFITWCFVTMFESNTEFSSLWKQGETFEISKMKLIFTSRGRDQLTKAFNWNHMSNPSGNIDQHNKSKCRHKFCDP